MYSDLESLLYCNTNNKRWEISTSRILFRCYIHLRHTRPPFTISPRPIKLCITIITKMTKVIEQVCLGSHVYLCNSIIDVTITEIVTFGFALCLHSHSTQLMQLRIKRLLYVGIRIEFSS